MRMTLKEAVERYGPLNFSAGKWPREAEFMGVLELPEELVFENWLVAGTESPVKKLYCNRDMAPALIAALYHVKERELGHELKTFDGLYNVRLVRGSLNAPSTHSYGLAIDINAKDNPLGGQSRFSPEFVQCFTDAGFSWGGNFKRLDAQHFSWAWE